jgi:hypothetical protein
MTEKILYWLNLHDGEGYDVCESQAAVMDAAAEILADAREDARLEGEWPEDIEGWEMGTMVVTHRPKPTSITVDGREHTEYSWEPTDAATDPTGWEPEEKWEDYDGGDGYNHVRPVWYVKGPEPFGGLRCADMAQAFSACAVLNSLTGRRPPAPKQSEPEAPHPVAVGIAEGMRGLGLTVSVQGDVLTFSDGADEHD